MRSLITVLLLALALAGCGDTPTTDVGADDVTPQGDPATVVPTTDDPAADDPATSSQPVDEDTPIPVEGEGDIGDGQGAPPPLATVPDFGVSSETDSGSISPYTSCWSAPDDDGGTVGACQDGIPQPEALTLTGADQLVVTFPEGDLTAGATDPGDADPGDAGTASDQPVEATELPVEQENPGIWLVDTSGLAPGEHVIMLAWYGDQGDAFTAFTLAVQR